MSTQIRDTYFGHLIRSLSRNKVFQYPDEVDSSLWEKPYPQNSAPGYAEDPLAEVTNKNDVEAHADKDVFLVDWYGPDDPENPHNWTSFWKTLVTTQICLINFGAYMGSSIYVPGEPSIEEDFGVGTIVATLGLSLFTIGYGTGPMLWSPLSEMPKLGRNGIYIYTTLAFVLLQLPTGYAVNMPMFLVFRFLTGFFGSPVLSTGGATIADMYDPARVAYGIAVWGSAGICGPVFGPIIGGFAAPVKGWQWTIWIISWLCGALWVMFFFLLPETSAANILYRRAKRLRRATGDDRWRSQSEIDAAHHTLRDELAVLGRAFTLTFFEPIVLLADLYTALLYGVLFLWFESFPLVFGDIYGFSVSQQGLAYLGIFVGGVVTVPLFLLWVKKGVIPAFSKPNFKPEMVLPPTFFGSAALPICLFWYGWTARESVPWILPIIGSSFFTVGVVTLFQSVLNYLGIAYPAYAASIFAGNTLFRATFGASFPLFARQLFQTLGIGPGNSLLGGISVCFIPLPYIIYRYGDRIRQTSKHARHDI